MPPVHARTVGEVLTDSWIRLSASTREEITKTVITDLIGMHPELRHHLGHGMTEFRLRVIGTVDRVIVNYDRWTEVTPRLQKLGHVLGPAGFLSERVWGHVSQLTTIALAAHFRNDWRPIDTDAWTRAFIRTRLTMMSRPGPGLA